MSATIRTNILDRPSAKQLGNIDQHDDDVSGQLLQEQLVRAG